MPRRPSSALALAALVTAVACSDAPTEAVAPRTDASEPTMELRAPELIGLDARYAELAREIPGFGGAYRDGSGRTVVHVAGRDLTTEGSSIRQSLQGRLAGSMRPGVEGPMAVTWSDGVVLEEAAWNYLDLVDFRDRAMPALSMPGAVYTDIDERTNRVSIGIAPGTDREAFLAMLESRGIPIDAVTFREVAPIAPLKGSALDERMQPMGGGIQLIYPHPTPGYVFLCTMGFNVLGDFPGKAINYFLTNSHCSSTQGATEGTPYYQQAVARPDEKNRIAREIADLPYSDCGGGFVCRYSDATIAMYETARTPVKHGVIYRPESVNTGSLEVGEDRRFFRITDRADFPEGGEVLSKVGRTTGWTEGEVVATGVHMCVSGTNIILLFQDMVAADVAGGDSGSPVFMRNGDSDEVTLYGLLWGGGDGVFAFSSLFNIEFDFQTGFRVN